MSHSLLTHQHTAGILWAHHCKSRWICFHFHRTHTQFPDRLWVNILNTTNPPSKLLRVTSQQKWQKLLASWRNTSGSATRKHWWLTAWVSSFSTKSPAVSYWSPRFLSQPNSSLAVQFNAIQVRGQMEVRLPDHWKRDWWNSGAKQEFCQH